MKKILLPVITLFLISFGLSLVSCKDSSNTKKLLFIDVTLSPTDYVFSEGDIVKEHLIVKGLYSDGSEKTLSKESYSTNLTDDKVTSTTKSVTVTYQSKTKTIPISVRTDSKTLLFIDVTVTPTDYVFSDGESIKPHLTVKGLYSDSSEQVVTDYTVSPTVVTSTTDKVTVTYQSKTKSIPISVGSMVTLNDIEVTINTDKLYEGDEIKDYLTVTGIYSDGVKTISKESYSTNLPNDKVTSTTNSVTISYTDGSVTKTKNKPIVLGNFSDYELGENWFSNCDGIIKSAVHSISFVKEKPSDATLIRTVGKLSYYKKYGNNPYIVGDRKIIFPSDCSDLFRGFKNVTEINLTDANIDTSNVTNMAYMFCDCESLNSLDLSRFDTSNVTNMEYMFVNCERLISLDLSSFNTSNVTNMDFMFESCKKLTSLDLSSFDITSTINRTSVPTIDRMFIFCGIRGTSTIKINPTNKDRFDGVLSESWTYDGVNTYKKTSSL